MPALIKDMMHLGEDDPSLHGLAIEAIWCHGPMPNDKMAFQTFGSSSATVMYRVRFTEYCNSNRTSGFNGACICKYRNLPDLTYW